MSVAISENRGVSGEQRLVLKGIGYDVYEKIADALGDEPSVRLYFVDGRLTFVTASRRHEWFAERLAELVKAVASASGVRWEDSGSATYRVAAQVAGVEGDKVFYLGGNAERMQGPVNIDLATQPPPNLAIEVEVTHSADDALLVYGRIGVPEVWRFDVEAWTLAFCLRREDGTFQKAAISHGLPVLKSAEVLDQLRVAELVGASRWSEQLSEWIRDTLLPRIADQG